MEEFTRFINTEQGLQFVLQLSGAVTALALGYYFIFSLAINCIGDLIMMAGRYFYTHTKHYRKKHEKILATYDACEDIVLQLWTDDMVTQGQYTMLRDSLAEYMERHTRK